jgi:murein DD-endopeptidase
MSTQRLVGWLAIVGLVVLYVRKQAQALGWPLTGPIRITSGFGARTAPTTGASTYHNGIDLAAPIGTAVYAPASGTVNSLYTNSEGGKQLLMKHDTGFISGFAHLASYAVAIGQSVRKGQLIAYTGNTGNTTGPHLHFSLKDKTGSYVNPLDYVA